MCRKRIRRLEVHFWLKKIVNSSDKCLSLRHMACNRLMVWSLIYVSLKYKNSHSNWKNNLMNFIAPAASTGDVVESMKTVHKYLYNKCFWTVWVTIAVQYRVLIGECPVYEVDVVQNFQDWSILIHCNFKHVILRLCVGASVYSQPIEIGVWNRAYAAKRIWPPKVLTFDEVYARFIVCYTAVSRIPVFFRLSVHSCDVWIWISVWQMLFQHGHTGHWIYPQRDTANIQLRNILLWIPGFPWVCRGDVTTMLLYIHTVELSLSLLALKDKLQQLRSAMICQLELIQYKVSTVYV